MKLPPAVRLDVPQMEGSGTHALQHGQLRVLLTDAEDHGEEGHWRHVSVSHPGRMPTYEELSAIRDEYFDPAATVLQVMPPVSAWVNQHERCLHLWQRLDRPILPRGLDRTVGMAGGLPFDDRESALLQRGHLLPALVHNLLRARGTLNVREAETVLARYITGDPADLRAQIVTVLDYMARTLPLSPLCVWRYPYSSWREWGVGVLGVNGRHLFLYTNGEEGQGAARLQVLWRAKAKCKGVTR